MYNIIFAISKNGVVGNSKSKYGMPWHYREDLQFYKQKTETQACIMGHNTYRAIGGALPNRDTYVLSTDTNLKLADCRVINDPWELEESGRDIWICGGPTIYRLYWQKARFIYITRIDKEYDGDVYFTDFDLNGFKLIDSHKGENSDLLFEVWRNINV